ncbi:MAG: hypothetical protein HY652_01820 [Acidobacteria bacterium]|nr:hypothetical protein [Acidobacteriota bacterium]
MTEGVGPNHPLRKLFVELTSRSFVHRVGLTDFQICQYVSNLLVDFAHVDNLYKIRGARGQRLEDVAAILVEWHPFFQQGYEEWEQEIRRHIGDFTLFFAGMFPESLHHIAPTRLDSIVDYIQTGKQSYYRASQLDRSREGEGKALLRKLSDRFETCVVGLNFVKGDLEKLQGQYVQTLREIITD